MPVFGRYDPSLSPAPLIGLYDTMIIPPNLMPPASELIEMTDEQLNSRPSELWAVENGKVVEYTPPTPPLTPDQLLAQKIALGLSITSSEFACKMGLDGVTVGQIGSVARDASSGLGLPLGESTYSYNDMTGTPRSFTESQVIALYKAQRDLIHQLNAQVTVMRNGGTPAWPDQTAVIP